MRRLLVLLLMLTAGAVLPSTSLAGVTAVTTADFAPGSDSTSSVPRHVHRFTLVGLHWRGGGTVLFRTRSLAGHWTSWRRGAPEDEDGPDRGSQEDRARGWHIGSPWWVGPSNRLEIRATGTVARVRARLVWSPASSVSHRAPANAVASSGTVMPAIVSRADWGANESIRRAPPSYAPSVRFAIVHHTAGSNTYSRDEAAAIVRGIQLYHVRSNGWNDIGYNFLVDRFGTIYEGRYGGVDRNVVGAHALGFNTGSTGVALLGTYGDAKPSRAALDSLARLLAWRLDLAHVDPLSIVTVLSGGSERFRANVPVRLRAISGHRDTGLTECPGDRLYGQLNGLAAAAAKLGGPKIFEPRVDADAEGLVRLTARTSVALPWNVVVKRGTAEVARGTGNGTSVDWTWDAAAASPATYTWAISAGTARSASGTIRAGLNTTELAILEPSTTPESITPNGDGQADSALLSFTLSTAANVTVAITAAEQTVATVIDRVWTAPGTHSVTLDGTGLPDGLYSVVVSARTPGGTEVVQSLPLTVSRTLGLVSTAPSAFSPNGDGRADRLAIGFMLNAPATVTVKVLREGRWVASLLQPTTFAAGPERVVWDGSRSVGTLADGTFSAVVEVTDEVGTVAFATPFVVDTIAPRLSLLSGRRLRVEVSEPVTLKIWINGQLQSRDIQRARVLVIPWAEPVRRVRAVAWDSAGNVSAPAVWRSGSGRG